MPKNHFPYPILSVCFFFLICGCAKAIITPMPQERAPAPPPARVPAEPVKKTTAPAKKTERKERPYSVNGTWYFPVASVAAYKEKGVCSWYGPDFHGKPTSSGETYDMHEYTAAHRTLPFNTQIRVKNPSNNKEIIVRVNDRGPFMKDRILDLSYSGAKALGLVGPGTARIELEALGILEEVEENGQRVTRLVQQIDFQQGKFSVQIGAFRELQNAKNLIEKLAPDFQQIEILETMRSGETYFRVRTKPFSELQEAINNQKQLEGLGYPQAMVIAD
ncbi:MAG: septal ring lytic transglycosylase RlpA family protein [Thermodesulfobacteriota bacterium]